MRCEPSTFTDRFGNELVREDVCYNPGTSVVVRTTVSSPAACEPFLKAGHTPMLCSSLHPVAASDKRHGTR